MRGLSLSHGVVRSFKTAPGGTDEFCRTKKKDGLPTAPRNFSPLLQRDDVLCLQPLRTLLDDELHRLTLFQAAETVALDRREVYEYILAVLARDESVSLSVVKPLHSSLFHVLQIPFGESNAE